MVDERWTHEWWWRSVRIGDVEIMKIYSFLIWTGTMDRNWISVASVESKTTSSRSGREERVREMTSPNSWIYIWFHSRVDVTTLALSCTVYLRNLHESNIISCSWIWTFGGHSMSNVHAKANEKFFESATMNYYYILNKIWNRYLHFVESVRIQIHRRTLVYNWPTQSEMFKTQSKISAFLYQIFMQRTGHWHNDDNTQEKWEGNHRRWKHR